MKIFEIILFFEIQIKCGSPKIPSRQAHNRPSLDDNNHASLKSSRQQHPEQTSDLITPKGSFRTKGSSGHISTIRVWELTSFAYMKCDTVKQIIWMKPLYKVRTASIISTNLTKVNVIILLGGGFKHLFQMFTPKKDLKIPILTK